MTEEMARLIDSREAAENEVQRSGRMYIDLLAINDLMYAVKFREVRAAWQETVKELNARIEALRVREEALTGVKKQDV